MMADTWQALEKMHTTKSLSTFGISREFREVISLRELLSKPQNSISFASNLAQLIAQGLHPVVKKISGSGGSVTGEIVTPPISVAHVLFSIITQETQSSPHLTFSMASDRQTETKTRA